MFPARPNLLGVDEALPRITSGEARVRVTALPTSRNSSHLRAAAGAPQRIAEALLRDEGSPYAENGAALADRRNVEYIGALAPECDETTAWATACRTRARSFASWRTAWPEARGSGKCWTCWPGCRGRAVVS